MWCVGVLQILSINMQMQADNTSVGFVRVPTAEEANHVIAQFHRKKIGYKRIHVALHDGSSPAAAGIKYGYSLFYFFDKKL